MKLPVEIISLIVNYVNHDDLYACALVNKKFHTATLPVLWQQPTVEDQDSLIKVISGMMASQHSLAKHIRRLDFGNFVNDTIFMLFMPHVHLLEELILQDAPLITDRSFQHVPRQCPHLNDLYLVGSPITTQSMRSLGQHCHQLTHLSLQDCPHLSCDIFAALVDCPLTSLTIDMDTIDDIKQDTSTVMTTAVDLADLAQLTFMCLWNAPTPFLEYVATINGRHGNVTWPHLTTCIFAGDNTLDDQHTITFLQRHPNLIDVSLGSTVHTDASLYAIAAFLPRIQSVVMNANGNITPNGLRHLADHCPLLRHVNIF